MYHLAPSVRLWLAGTGLLGSGLCLNWLWLLGFWLVYLLPVAGLTVGWRAHGRLLGFGMLPVLLSFVLLYVLIPRPDGADGPDYALRTFSKLLVLTTVLQVTLTIPPTQLLYTLQRWRLRGQTLILVIGALTVWNDIQIRADKVLTARFARGFVPRRTRWHTMRQLPHTLIPLLVGIIRTAAERAESWHQKQLTGLLAGLAAQPFPVASGFNLLVVIGAVGWLALNFAASFGLVPAEVLDGLQPPSIDPWLRLWGNQAQVVFE